MAEEQTRHDGLPPDLPEPTSSAAGQPAIAAQARAELPHLEAEEQRLLRELERLRTELTATEAAHDRVTAALMRARRAAITGEPVGPREGDRTA